MRKLEEVPVVALLPDSLWAERKCSGFSIGPAALRFVDNNCDVDYVLATFRGIGMLLG